MKRQMQIDSINKAKKEIYELLDFVEDKLIREPTMDELTTWQIEIDRAIFAKSKKVTFAGAELSGAYFEMVERLLKSKGAKK